MFGNPIIQRYCFNQFRPQQLWIFGTLYVAVILLIFFINTSIYSIGEMFVSTQDLYSSLFIQFSVLQVLILWLFMPLSCSNVVPREIADKSFDFFRLLPLPSTDKAVGILVGRNIFAIVVSIINLCLWSLFGLLGQISINLLLQSFILLITVSLALNSVALLFSILSFKNTKSTSTPVLIIVGMFAFGPILGVAGDTVGDGKIGTILVDFFNLKIPVLYLISAYVFVGGIWAFVGICRRFSCEYEPLFSRKGALGFMVCYLFVVYALYHNFLFNIKEYDIEFLFYSFYGVAFIPLIGIGLLSVRTFDKYIEITRLASRGNTVIGKIFFNSNFFLGILLCLLWLAAAFSVGIITDSLQDFCKLTMLFAVSWLIIISLIEIYAIYLPKNAKIAYLLVFFAGLYLILPILLAGLFDYDYLAMFSPVGVIYSYETYSDFEAIIPPFIVSIALLTPLLLLIGRRYSTIAKLRSSINTAA